MGGAGGENASQYCFHPEIIFFFTINLKRRKRGQKCFQNDCLGVKNTQKYETNQRFRC
jgi:hypothetical protein